MHPFEVLAHPLKSLTDDVFELKAPGEKKVFRMWEMKDESLILKMHCIVFFPIIPCLVE